MGEFLESYRAEACCLCGSYGSHAGEHKLKASILRKIFGNNHMLIGNFDRGTGFRTAQGVKSKAFHFSARMCSSCNGYRTQPADREFDIFHSLVSSFLSEGGNPSKVFDIPKYNLGSEEYLNVFRYFSKILCCQIAESCGPRLLEACGFAIGCTSRNIIHLDIDSDPFYQSCQDAYGKFNIASHGGLRVHFDSKTHNQNSFSSSLSLGPVRYSFSVEFDEAVEIELRTFHRSFWLKCEASVQEAIKNSLSEN